MYEGRIHLDNYHLPTTVRSVSTHCCMCYPRGCSVTIMSKHLGYCFEVLDGRPESSTYLVVNNCNPASASQAFDIKPLEHGTSQVHA